MDILNDSAHASFAMIMTCMAIAADPGCHAYIKKHVQHWQKLCDYLDYMQQMFAGGKTKMDVLAGVKNLHRPPSAWHAASKTVG